MPNIIFRMSRVVKELKFWVKVFYVIQLFVFCQISSFAVFFYFFNYRWPVKHEIWQSTESLAELKILLKFDIFDHRGPAKHAIWQNTDSWVRLKIWQIAERPVLLNILTQHQICEHCGVCGPGKRWNLAKNRKFSQIKNLIQN